MARRRPELTPVAGVEELLKDSEAAWNLDEGRARALLPRVAALHAILAAKSVAPGVAPVPASPTLPAPSPNDDDLLTADEVAALLKKPRNAVYSLLRRKDLVPAVVRINRRTLRVRRGELLQRLGGRSSR